MPKAIIMLGVPGSGKTTWLNKNHPDITVCSADHYRVNPDGKYVFEPEKQADIHKTCLREFVYFCNRWVGCVAVDNTNTNLEDVGPYISVAEAYGYDVRPVILQSVRSYGRQTHGVPYTAWCTMMLQLETMLSNWPKRWPPVLFVNGDQ